MMKFLNSFSHICSQSCHLGWMSPCASADPGKRGALFSVCRSDNVLQMSLICKGNLNVTCWSMTQLKYPVITDIHLFYSISILNVVDQNPVLLGKMTNLVHEVPVQGVALHMWAWISVKWWCWRLNSVRCWLKLSNPKYWASICEFHGMLGATSNSARRLTASV